jgi:CAAX protease family protein
MSIRAISYKLSKNINHNGIFSFIGLSFGLAWSIWITAYFFNIPFKSPLFITLNMLAAFTPAIAAFIVRRYITKEGFNNVGFGISLKSWPYFLIAWLLPLIIISVTAYTANFLQLTELNFSVVQGLKLASNKPINFNLFVLNLMLGALVATFMLFGEEFGWRGFLQKKLFWHSPWKSAIATGIIWGVWHFPINLQGYNFPEHKYWGLIVFPLACIFLSYIFAWFYRLTNSIWSSCLAHASFNSIAGSLMVVLYVNKTNYILTSVTGIIGICTLALISLILHCYTNKLSS